MAVTGALGSGRALSLDTLVRVGRAAHTPGAPRRLTVPEGMTTPLGCDAVAVPAHLGSQLMPRLPRVGCVYADRAHWWWIVPADSDYALHWPAPAHYSTGAVLPAAPHPTAPALVHRPRGTIPYTPPIPLYLALCRVTGATPSWSRPVTA
ncbi:hypothetical protein [Streptomyces kebangsaanensis]|uniref:hypothetical protein n=1 Tax=Streptomyces kebangsaanensis TaxID=864058 RepID=UPI0009400286|nr:hypothetical protein [Streptomyces kebangsaanensis]